MENRGIDSNLFDSILMRIRSSSVVRTLAITAVYLGYGEAGMKMIANENLANIRGTLHGGIIASLADTAMGYSIQSLGLRGVTLDLNLHYCTPVATETEIIAEGKVIHTGKSIVVVEALLFTSNRKLAAKSTGTFYLIPAPK